MAEEGTMIMSKKIITETSSKEAMDDTSINVSKKKNRIHVSNTKMPFVFYLNLAKKYMKQYNDVELSALGMAIPTVVVISEILKGTGAAQKSIFTTTVKTKDEATGKVIRKAKIEIVMATTGKSDKPKVNAPTSPMNAANHKTDAESRKTKNTGEPTAEVAPDMNASKTQTEIGTEKTEDKQEKITSAVVEEKADEKK